jgi:hypothetical protein
LIPDDLPLLLSPKYSFSFMTLTLLIHRETEKKLLVFHLNPESVLEVLSARQMFWSSSPHGCDPLQGPGEMLVD